MTNKDQSKYPYDRSEYVVMPPIRKAEDGTLTTEKLDVESLKKPIPALDYDDSPYLNGLDEGNAKGWNDCIDHLAASGYLRAPLPRIDGLDDALIKYGYIADQEDSQLSSSEEWYPVDEFKMQSIVKAARAYLKASGV